MVSAAAKDRRQPGTAMCGSMAGVIVRSEVLSPTEFVLLIEGARSPSVHAAIVRELGAALKAGEEVCRQLVESDRCELGAKCAVSSSSRTGAN